MPEPYVSKTVDEFRKLILVIGANSSLLTRQLIFEGSPAEQIFGLFHIMSNIQFRDDKFLFFFLPILQQNLDNLVAYVSYQESSTLFEFEFFRNEINKLKEWLRTQSVSYQLFLDKLELDKTITNLTVGCVPYDPKYGVTEEEYRAGCYEMIGKIRSNLINVLEPSLLKRILEQADHAIVIGFIPTIDKRSYSDPGQHLTGFFDVQQNIVFISWKPHVQDHEVQYVLTNEYQHVALCKLRDIPNLAECTFPPEHRVFRSFLMDAYNKIEDYEKIITTNPETAASSLQDFYEASACYEPMVYYVEVPNYDHGLLLKNGRTRNLANNYIFLPALEIAPPGSPLGMGDTYVEYTQLNDNVMLYKARFATETSKSAEKAKAFLLDMKMRHINYRPGGVYANSAMVMYGVKPGKQASNSNRFFTQGSPGEVAERLSDLGYLPPQLLKTFFGDVCDKLSDVFKIEDYCDHPMTRCGIK